MIRCVQVKVTGKVQGVFFRAFTEEQANRLGLSGWVRNLPDGAVQALVQGETARVETMLDWFATGSPRSRVDSVTVAECAPDASITHFSIRYEQGALAP